MDHDKINEEEETPEKSDEDSNQWTAKSVLMHKQEIYFVHANYKQDLHIKSNSSP